jgi:hypothetical protein
MHIKSLRNFYTVLLVISHKALLAIALIGCGCDSDNSSLKKECKLRLEAPTSTIRKGALTFRLHLTVVEGKCITKDYILVTSNKALFQHDDWTALQPNKDQQTVIEEKATTSLEKWLNDKDNPTLQEGESKKITIPVAKQTGGESSIFTFSIVNKKLEIIVAPIEVKWTTAP